MKKRIVACMILLAALLPGCAKEKNDKIIPGYGNPGEFRPKGVLTTKEITFATAPLNLKNCSGNTCLAVFANWLAGSFLVSGFAISDKNLATPTYSMKVTQGLVGWKITLIIDRNGTQGVKYEKDISRNDFTVNFCRDCEYALPACSPPTCAEEYEAEGAQLVQATITFNNDITLVNNNPTYNEVIIRAGDRIVAQAYNVSVDNYCVPCPATP